MGANVNFRVKVLRTVEEWVEVNALTSVDAREEAQKLPGVITVLDVKDDDYVEGEN